MLSALGLGVVVFGVLQASTWGWLEPLDSPIEPFGFSLVPFVVAAGALVLLGFVAWERRQERIGKQPLVHLRLFSIPSLRSGAWTLLAQNMILMGIFFTVPLYLQVVQGLDALETGVRMLPASVCMFLMAIVGAALSKRFGARPLVRIGLLVVLVSVLLLLGTINPQLDDAGFLIAMGVLGSGIGLVVSQLGNVVQSSVGDEDRSEAGGIQNTALQLGSSLGTAVLGAIVITGLLGSFSSNVQQNPEISASVKDQVSVAVSSGGSFVQSDEVRAAAEQAGVGKSDTENVVAEYEDAQLQALKTALLGAGLLILLALPFTRNLPTRPLGEADAAAPAAGPSP